MDLKTHRALGCDLCFIGVGLLKPWSQLPLGDSCVEDGNVAADSEVRDVSRSNGLPPLAVTCSGTFRTDLP